MNTKVAELENRILILARELEHCRSRCILLEREVEFLRLHPTISQGLKGERLVCQLTGGMLTKYAEKYDVALPNLATVEVKHSKLNIPVHGSSTRRWNWSKPLGHLDKGKEYDFLILLGEKDERYPEQYVDDSPFVCFLVPRDIVPSLSTKGRTVGGMIQLSSNLSTGWSEKSAIIRRHMISLSDIESLLNSAKPLE